MRRLFNLDLQLITDSVLTIIAVFVLFLVLSRFLFNPVRKMLSSRSAKIADDIESAQKDKTDAAAMKAEYEEKLKSVDKEAEAILADARKRGLENENRIIAQAKEEAAAILERARTEAELEKQKAADEVKREMITIASAMASKVVAANIDTTIQNSLIDETLKEMGEGTWLS
ncbi:MAG: F0F1 ATP synthase subunit B [Clostridium sp.]|nr:F0F1 ATP synthase subunit B [Clostridium sp.]